MPLLQRRLGPVLRRAGRSTAAHLLARPVLRLSLGRWPNAEEVRLFRRGFGASDSRIPPLLRSLTPVPAARPHLTRAMLLAWMETSAVHRDLLSPGADPAGTVLMGDPLQVWSGPPVAFLHLEKTAGSSLMEVLQGHFHPLQIDPDPHRTCPPHLLTPFAGGAAREARRHALVWGHYDLPALLRLDPARPVLTLLREPRQRLLSLYYFWRATVLSDAESRRDNFGPTAAQSRSLLGFLRSPERRIRDYIDNVYVRRLTGRYASPAARDPLETDADGSLALALQALDGIAFAGLSERMDDTLVALGTLLGFAPPPRAPRVNELGTRIAAGDPGFRPVRPEAVSDEVAAELDRLTKLDGVVYAAAVRRFNAEATRARHVHLGEHNDVWGLS